MSGLLAAYPQLKTADVHANDFHTVSIAVFERVPKALWCSDTCYLMDEDGVVYTPVARGALRYITYLGAASTTPPVHYLTQDQFHSLSALVDALAQKEASTSIQTVSVDAAGDVEAVFTGSFVLKFRLADAGGDIFERFTLALQSDPFKAHPLSAFLYLDLRFGDKLYYKLR